MNGTPWWFSGGEDSEGSPGPDASSGQPRIGADWGTLLSGAQRVIDWATETVMAPHAEHDIPREHPECVICRGLSLIGEGGPAGFADDATADDGERSHHTIEWIPIREERPES